MFQKPKLQNKKPDDIDLGKYKNHDVIIKDGRYGPYLNYNGKNINLKYIQPVCLKTLVSKIVRLSHMPVGTKLEKTGQKFLGTG